MFKVKKNREVSHSIDIADSKDVYTMNKKKGSYNRVSIPVFCLKEGDLFVVMTPALDVVAQGETFEEAHENFDTTVKIFFEECIKHGTLEKALEESGWIKVKKPTPHFQPPVLIENRTQTFAIPLHLN